MMKNVFTGMVLLALGAAGLSAQMKPPTPAEVKGLQAVVGATTPDAKAAAVDDFVKNFPTSEYRSSALTEAANAYESTGNSTKAILYYQQAVEVNPKDFNAMLMLAGEIARTTREFDLDKEEKLVKAEKYARDGMALLPTAAKPNPALTDEQWEAVKKEDLSRGHEALGLAALARKKYDAAAAEFKIATETAVEPLPTTLIRLAGAYTDAGKPEEAIPVLDKVLAMTNLPSQFTRVAQSEKTRAEKAKASKK